MDIIGLKVKIQPSVDPGWEGYFLGWGQMHGDTWALIATASEGRVEFVWPSKVIFTVFKEDAE